MSKPKTIHSEESKRLCGWLNKMRREREVSIRKLSELLDWPNSTLGRMLVGDRHLDVVEYVAICEALKVNACEGLKQISQAHKPPPKAKHSKHSFGQ